jgi:transcriptional regulator with XRE-family HTH domain
MPFTVTTYEDDSEKEERKIIGSYFRVQRISQNLSLIEASKTLNINKGFLSDLERGNRHFPEGIINQLNEFYLTEFNPLASNKKNSLLILNKAYYYLFYKQNEQEIEILKKNINPDKKHLNSLSFFTYHLIYLFYYIRVDLNKDKVDELSKLLEDNINALSQEEKAIYYSLLAIYNCSSFLTTSLAMKYIELSNSYCSRDSIIYCMNSYMLTLSYGRENKNALSLMCCSKVKNLLREKNNYIRQVDIDIVECSNLILLGEIKEAQKRLLESLNSGNANINDSFIPIYNSLAFSYILSKDYQKCIDIIEQYENELPEEMLWFKPFCLFSTKNYEACILSLDNLKVSDRTTQNFLLALRYRVNNDFVLFMKYISLYYYSKLENMVYLDIPFVLHFILDYAKEVNDTEINIDALEDLDLFHNNILSINSSNVLKKK